MKSFFLLTPLLFFSSSLLSQKNISGSWVTKFEYQKAFVENKGQFSIPVDFGNPSPVLFAIDHGGTKIYFTKKGITYTLLEATKKQRDAREIERERREKFRNPEEHMRHEKEEHQLKVKADQVTMLWQNANANVFIESNDVTSDYHNYYFKQPDGEYKNISNIKGFKKITYKNLYPNIDVEYVFHEKDGLKYSLILHPGADPSLVKMVYDNHISLNNNGDIRISTKFGDIIDHAPLTFYQQNKSSIINSSFIKNGKTVSFQLENYDNTKPVIIDPWTQTPTFASNWDCVWECEKDGAGNVYIIGGVLPMQLLKYNSTGALQWTYNTPYDTTSWLGTFIVDNIGNSYVTNGSVAKILALDNTGTTLWMNNGGVTIGNTDEYWSLALNCDHTKLVVGGTTISQSSSFIIKGAIFDIDINTGIPTNTQVIAYGSVSTSPPSIQEVRSIAAGKNGKYYFLTLDSIGSLSQNFQNCNIGATLYKTKSNYNLGYKCENFRYDNSGIEAICANDSFLYTQNGTHVHKRSLATGAILDTAIIPGGASTISQGQFIVANSGIDIDACGNVYVGSTNAVIKFDGNTLTQLAAYPTSYNVYDVIVNSNGDIIACGSTGNSSTSIRSGYIESVYSGTCTPMTQTCCDASICKPTSLCTSDSLVTLQSVTAGGIWNGNGIINNSLGVFDPSIAGVGIHTIKYILPCGFDSILVTVNSCSSVSVCSSSGLLSAFGGNGNYLWASTSTSVNCSSCPGGACIPSICAGITAPVWTASGTTIPTPSANIFPITIKDVNTNTTFTFTSLSSIPSCSATNINQLTQEKNQATIYPNPNSGEFSISYSFEEEGQDLVLIDLLGKEIKQIKLENSTGIKTINVFELSNGLYSYKIQNKNRIITTGKISVSK